MLEDLEVVEIEPVDPRRQLRGDVLHDQALVRVVAWVHPRLVWIALIASALGCSVRRTGKKPGRSGGPVGAIALAGADVHVAEHAVPATCTELRELRVAEVAGAWVGVDVDDAEAAGDPPEVAHLRRAAVERDPWRGVGKAVAERRHAGRRWRRELRVRSGLVLIGGRHRWRGTAIGGGRMHARVHMGALSTRARVDAHRAGRNGERQGRGDPLACTIPIPIADRPPLRAALCPPHVGS
jgi:hypothetical protein